MTSLTTGSPTPHTTSGDFACCACTGQLPAPRHVPTAHGDPLQVLDLPLCAGHYITFSLTDAAARGIDLATEWAQARDEAERERADYGLPALPRPRAVVPRCDDPVVVVLSCQPTAAGLAAVFTA